MSKLVMSKEYELPEEQEDLIIDAKAKDLYYALWKIQQEVRQYVRHVDFEHEETEEVVDRIYQFIIDETITLGVDL